MEYLLYVISLFSFIASIVIIPNPVGILCVLLLFTTLYNVEIKKTIYKKVYYILLLYSIAYCDIGIAVNRIDHVNYLNNGFSLCLYLLRLQILGVIIIDRIYSGHFKRKND